MKTRPDYRKAATDAFKAMRDLGAAVHRTGLEPSLIELVKMRASQINGWNRLAIGFRSQAGSYGSAGKAK